MKKIKLNKKQLKELDKHQSDQLYLLSNKVNERINRYFTKDFDWRQLQQIRFGIDLPFELIDLFAKKEYDENKMLGIRLVIEKMYYTNKFMDKPIYFDKLVIEIEKEVARYLLKQ